VEHRWSVLPARAEAAIYRAMATLPGITVQQGITNAAGKAAIGISDNGGYNQLLLSPVTYQVTGLRVASDGASLLRGGWGSKGTLILSIGYSQVTRGSRPRRPVTTRAEKGTAAMTID
jgi:hypothetical protein